MYYKIKRIWDYIRYDIPRGIKNLVIWFPTVWCDRQWDHHFIYTMLRQKLHFSEQYIRHYGLHEDNIRDADRMKRCVDLLDRLIEDVHHDEAFEEHYKKWGEPEMRWEDVDEQLAEDTDINGDDYVQLHIDYPNANTPLEKEGEKIDFRKACNKENAAREADIEELFETIKKHIQEWWD